MHLSEGKVISGSRVMSAGKEGTETFRPEGWPKCWLIYLMRVEGKK